ncbi:MAG: hypothetical protein KGJ73_12560 [Rhodospirillales bacterium]|nr:hypothetical protein [Rhodospirillales bacterium]
MKIRKVAALRLILSGALPVLVHPALAAGIANNTSDSSTLAASLGTTALSGAQLSKLRGGSGTVAAVNLGTDTGNSADHSVTGSISNLQSVNNNTGLTTVIQNTGNNSLLQSSMTVNITVH